MTTTEQGGGEGARQGPKGAHPSLVDDPLARLGAASDWSSLSDVRYCRFTGSRQLFEFLSIFAYM